MLPPGVEIDEVDEGHAVIDDPPDIAEVDVTDWWDSVVAQHAWVRHHGKSRQALFTPGGYADGPEEAELAATTVTHATYVDGTVDVIRDDWGSDTAQRILALAWVRETWFFTMGHVPGEQPFRRRLRGKQQPRAEVPEAEVIRALHTGAGVNRQGLMASMSGMGIEKVKLGAAQRLCPELAAYYTVHLAWGAGADPR